MNSCLMEGVWTQSHLPAAAAISPKLPVIMINTLFTPSAAGCSCRNRLFCVEKTPKKLNLNLLKPRGEQKELQSKIKETWKTLSCSVKPDNIYIQIFSASVQPGCRSDKRKREARFRGKGHGCHRDWSCRGNSGS